MPPPREAGRKEAPRARPEKPRAHQPAQAGHLPARPAPGVRAATSPLPAPAARPTDAPSGCAPARPLPASPRNPCLQLQEPPCGVVVTDTGRLRVADASSSPAVRADGGRRHVVRQLPAGPLRRGARRLSVPSRRAAPGCRARVLRTEEKGLDHFGPRTRGAAVWLSRRCRGGRTRLGAPALCSGWRPQDGGNRERTVAISRVANWKKTKREKSSGRDEKLNRGVLMAKLMRG